MFKKYNINDLFLASVSIVYPYREYDSKTGFVKLAHGSFKYNTILLKKEDKFIDLQKKFIPVITSYKINFLEPLSKYYTQEGAKTTELTKRKAINIGKQHYNEFQQSEVKNSYVKQKRNKKS